MHKIIECVPNFSEGKNLKIIREITNTIKKVPKVRVLDIHSDISHNRSVITFAGPPSEVTKAAFLAIKKASQLIDLNKHKGEHPRIGATDVCPLIPLKNVSVVECKKYAEKLAKKVATELNIPVYLYEKSAKRPERKNLANIRNQGYEKLKTEIEKNPKFKPDFGPKKIGKAGATVIGARNILIAYNVNLKTNNLQIAKEIAKKIREKDGGLKGIKALGINLKEKNIVQVSMNIVDYKATPPQTVFEKIKKEAEKHGVEILESELIGLIPQDALPINAKKSLKLNITDNQVVDKLINTW